MYVFHNIKDIIIIYKPFIIFYTYMYKRLYESNILAT